MDISLATKELSENVKDLDKADRDDLTLRRILKRHLNNGKYNLKAAENHLRDIIVKIHK